MKSVIHARKSSCLLAGLLLPFLAVQAGEPGDKEPEWSVDNPPGPSTTATIDVRSGTWMNVDISPDGETLVFDLLGDIFTMPVSGGEASQVTSGMAWDMQPRFSPDGSEIAFTSDRAGGNNIWIMQADGSNPRQVTDESFRLLNNPEWAPDGDYIVARKHFTKSRSLGSGEMWLYHRSGGTGLQLTEKPNDQTDVNDPAFSPDGRYLYFDQDVSPGSNFEYNKDSTGQIYVIKRLDRQTGEITDYVTGAGGAVKPVPSPDGKWLAFVRRVNYDTHLFLKNIESGEIIDLHDSLERDMQEIWAIHGVYSNFTWTPDSEEIIFWAEGKLKRIEIASREVSEIPFHVKKDMEMREALRQPHEVAPEKFHTRMLRFAAVSPDEDQVVFEALGKLWVRELPDGKPRRLTRQDEHFELYPAWSRDGSMITYVTWDDEALGSVRIVSARGGNGTKVNSKPGHFVEPAFSPDGKQLAFRRIEGGYLRSPLWSENPGIYLVSTRGGEPKLVTKNGALPHFGGGNDRVYLLRSADNARQLVSVDLEGDKERVHYSSEWANDFRISPDGEWLAFQQRFNAYVTPFVETGKAIDIGPDSKAIPVAQVSRDAGDYLHWNGGSDTLYWMTGPELFRQDLASAFAFLADGAAAAESDGKPAGPVADGVDIGFAVDYDKPASKIALVGARIITMQGDEIIEHGVVLVKDNLIEKVGAADEIEIPAGYEAVDVTGKTIIPGIIDVHWHGAQGTNEFIPETNWVNMASLAFGVTTIHDPSNDTSTIFAASELAKAGEIIAPRIFSTGTILYGATTSFTAEVDSLDDALSHLRRMKAVGAFSVKSYNQPRRNQRQQILEAGRQLDMLVVPEGGALFQTNMTMVVDGHTGVEHSLSVENVYEDVLQLWSQNEVGYTPTLGVAYGGIMGENYWYQHTDVLDNERLMRWVPYERVAPRARRRPMAPESDYNHIKVAEATKQLADAGVSVQLGAHGQREGLAAHWEMWMFAQGGMTPLEVIRSATLRGAEYLGLDAELGSIEAGKLADMAILDKNPLEDIRNTDSVSLILVNGRLFETATMSEVISSPGEPKRKAGPLFFKEQPGGN